MPLNSNQPSEIVYSILHQLSTDEKIRLLGGDNNLEPASRNGDVFGIPRVGLPALKFADGPIGVHWWTQASTCYPASICLAATFDEEMAFRYGEAIGNDCRAHGIHVLLAPGVNLYRSPLCGRNFEYFGEDPELSGKQAAAYIRGVQSRGVAATIKHFAANNQEYDRHGVSSDIDERTLHEVYLRPFEIAVKEAHVACIMTAYGLLNGQHCSENAWLTIDVLRNQWQTPNIFVMSDWNSVYSTVQTMNSGLDIEMPWGKFLNHNEIKKALLQGTLTEETLNNKIIHRLALMDRFGWLDSDHQQKDFSVPSRNVESEAVALEVARRGIVMLKNEDSSLPALPNQTPNIAVLGHHAGLHILSGGGSAYTQPHESVSLIDALNSVYGEDTQIDYYPCIDIWRGEDAFKKAKYLTEDGQRGLKVNYYNNESFAGEPVFNRIDPCCDFYFAEKRPDSAITAHLFSASWQGIIEIEESGNYDFYMETEDGYLSATVDQSNIFAQQRGTYKQTRYLEKGNYPVQIRFQQSQTGYVKVRFGYECSALAKNQYEEGIKAAQESSLTIVTAGFVKQTEGESHDRPFELDPLCVKLISDASKACKRVVVLLYAGGAVQTDPWLEDIQALLCLWYPGQNGTLAAAEIIAGIANPSGKLPFTWEKSLADRGSYNCYHDHDNDKRVFYEDGVFIGYRWFEKHNIQAQFPFGYGLSYTTFKYENLSIHEEFSADQNLHLITFDVINTGKVSGFESALMFVGEDAPRVPRAIKELKAFQSVYLKPDERKTLKIVLTPRAFAFWDSQMHDWVIGSDQFTVYVGGSAQSTPLQATIAYADDKR